jgi:hypothetical protein
MTPRRFLAILLLLIHPLSAWCEVPKPRPIAGKGMLVIIPPPLEQITPGSTIPLYRQPGVGRVRDIPPQALPGLAPVLDDGKSDHHVAVLGTKGAWLKVAYDDAGREGWLALARHWRYCSWDEFLPGRVVHLFAGLSKGYYLLRTAPDAASREIRSVTRQQLLTVDRVQDDWMMVTIAGASGGWLRWRDDNGRFLITIEPRAHPTDPP